MCIAIATHNHRVKPGARETRGAYKLLSILELGLVVGLEHERSVRLGSSVVEALVYGRRSRERRRHGDQRGTHVCGSVCLLETESECMLVHGQAKENRGNKKREKVIKVR